MAASGRPTPRKDDGERPRFKDRELDDHRRPDVNPFLKKHFEWGHPLYPAREAWQKRGKWDEVFGRKAPLHVEIGSGNGFFLAELARRNPDWNVMGIEIRYKRTVRCAKKIAAAGVQNAVMLRYHAAYLDDLFEPGALAGLYVNHPDPWPKDRHEKNRLISRWFLEDVVQLLEPGGVFRLKSDYHDNVTRVAGLLHHGPDGEPMPALPLRHDGQTTDIDQDGAPWPDDIQTYYQQKMKGKGLTIAAIQLTRH